MRGRSACRCRRTGSASPRSALLGALVNPGLWLIGARPGRPVSVDALAVNARFRSDRRRGRRAQPTGTRAMQQLLAHLDRQDARDQQSTIEREARRARAICCTRAGATASQISDVRQMAWLHLKLLAARASFAASHRRRRARAPQARRAGATSASIASASEPSTTSCSRSLEQQLEVIASRHAAHADAERRLRARRRGDRAPAPADLAGARAGAARHRREQRRDFARRAVGVAQRSESLAQGSARVVRRLENFTDEPPPADLLRRSGAAATPQSFGRDGQGSMRMMSSIHFAHAAPPPATSSRCCCWHRHRSAWGCGCGCGKGAKTQPKRPPTPRTRRPRPAAAQPDGDAPDADRARHRHADARSRATVRAEGQHRSRSTSASTPATAASSSRTAASSRTRTRSSRRNTASR